MDDKDRRIRPKMGSQLAWSTQHSMVAETTGKMLPQKQCGRRKSAPSKLTSDLHICRIVHQVHTYMLAFTHTQMIK